MGQLPAFELRELLERGASLRRGLRPELPDAGPVFVLCAEPAPYVRAAVEAGAAMLGLRVAVLSPAEVAALGDPQVAAERLARVAGAVVGIGLAPQLIGAIAEKVPTVSAGDANGDPAGALADLWALTTAFTHLEGRKIAWVGDACGLLSDLLVAGCTEGMSVAVAHPVGFAPDAERVTWARERAALTGGSVLVTTDLAEALADAHAVYVEPWPPAAAERFRPYAVNKHQLRGAHAACCVLHRFPERRGVELSPSLTEGPGWLAGEQFRLRPYAVGALLWAVLR